MRDPIKVAVVAGFKAAPDYSLSWFESLLAQNDPRFNFVALASDESRRANFRHPHLHFVWTKNFLHPFQIWRAVRRENPGLVHIQNEINMFGGGVGVVMLPVLLALLRFSGFKTIVTLHALPALSEVHGHFSGLFSFPSSRVLSKFMKLGLRISIGLAGRLSNRVIVHSPLFKSRLEEDYGIDKKKIEIIPHLELHGISTLNERKATKKILFFGYVLQRKGIEILIQAFGQFADSHREYSLIIAGGTPQPHYEHKLKELAKKQNSRDRIIFLGSVDSASVFDLFRECEFVVIPAFHSFSASGPYAVALALEKPVIVPNIGYFSETVHDGIDGLFYDSQNISSLTANLIRLADDENLRHQLSIGMKNKRPAFSSDFVGQKTLGLYRDIVDGHP